MSQQKAAPERDGANSAHHHDHPPLVKLLAAEVEEPQPWQRVVSVRVPGEEWQQARAKV